MTITAFFNPRTEGDTFKGLNGSIGGNTADRIIPSTHDFLREAGRDYYIKRLPAPHPLFLERFQENEDHEGLYLPDTYWLARSSDGQVVSPKTVTNQYGILSLMDIADEVQPFCDAGWATPDGVYDRNHSLEVLSLRLDAGGEIAEGENFLHYIVIQNPHGGGTAQGKIISWRIVCENTFAAAVSAGYDFTISHRKGREDEDKVAKDRLARAVSTWDNVQKHISKLSESINTWQGMPIEISDAENLTDKLLGIEGEKEISGQARNTKERILSAFSDPRNGTYGRSAWDWYNAVTFTTSNPEKGSKVDPITRVVRNVTPKASGFKTEDKARELILSLA